VKNNLGFSALNYKYIQMASFNSSSSRHGDNKLELKMKDELRIFFAHSFCIMFCTFKKKNFFFSKIFSMINLSQYYNLQRLGNSMYSLFKWKCLSQLTNTFKF